MKWNMEYKKYKDISCMYQISDSAEYVWNLPRDIEWQTEIIVNLRMLWMLVSSKRLKSTDSMEAKQTITQCWTITLLLECHCQVNVFCQENIKNNILSICRYIFETILLNKAEKRNNYWIVDKNVYIYLFNYEVFKYVTLDIICLSWHLINKGILGGRYVHPYISIARC
jgi:hypothetical protein